MKRLLLAVLAVLALTVSPAQAKESFPACANEDGSGDPLPCIWDAQTQGNHRGESFVISHDEVTYYLAHATAKPKGKHGIKFKCAKHYKAKDTTKQDGYPAIRCKKK